MRYIKLGNTNVDLSVLGLGCINFGTTTSEEDAFRLMDCYLENGGNIFDTANNYAFWNGGDGRSSERVIGHFLSHNPEKRKDIVLCTKLGAKPATEDSIGFENMQGTSRKVIIEEVDKSLETLKTDYIDLLYLHVDDKKTPLEETLGALAEVVHKGYVRHIGCSNIEMWRVEQARNICRKYNYPFFTAIQQRYSYFQPTMDADFYPQICAGHETSSYLDFYKDMTMFSHTPLLHGAYLKDTIEDKDYNTPANQRRLDELKLQGEDKISWVLDYITKQFGGSVALFTSNNLEHLASNMAYIK